MDSREDFRARVAALEQQTEHLKQQTQAFVQTHALQAHTRTVERRLRWWRGLVCGILLMGLVSLPLPSGTAQSPAEETLAQRVAALEHTLRYVTSGEKEVVITGANLRLVNGLENVGRGPFRTAQMDLGTSSWATTKSVSLDQANRTGSHNVVVGRGHNFSRFGGIVVGSSNEISGDFASVSGGENNTASGDFASVSGGWFNTASGIHASVSGGSLNAASGIHASVSGGSLNTASGFESSVSGGGYRQRRQHGQRRLRLRQRGRR